jgi:hypothetical protein
VEAVSKCLAFSGYKAREDERAQGARKKRRTGEKEKTGAEPRIGRRKQRKKKLKKKKRETRGSSRSTGRTSCFYYHLLCREQGKKLRGLVKR